ncbi:MAG: hypothetical protein DCC49_03185 [Acidobacteria bacterium]|nr:MAG: hypothetical protein DCC49_03185 [Acidobacteriota bacterium]
MSEDATFPTRRDLLSGAAICSGLVLLAPVLSACAPQRVAAPPIGVVPPRIPEGSPDFDTLNTLLQLELREIALANEVIAGERLDPDLARLAGEIRGHHVAHSEALRRLINDAGGQAGEARERYVLPTPLGDQRRALSTLLEGEIALTSAYRNAIADMLTLRLTPVLSSNLFADSTHVAALRVALDSDRSIVAFA